MVKKTQLAAGKPDGYLKAWPRSRTEDLWENSPDGASCLKDG